MVIVIDQREIKHSLLSLYVTAKKLHFTLRKEYNIFVKKSLIIPFLFSQHFT